MASIDGLVEAARLVLARLEPRQAAKAMTRGAFLIDTRPTDERQRDGEIPGAIAIDRNVLEWRLDPTSPYRLPQLAGSAPDTTIILICNEGYSSSLAAATLQRLGLTGATDVIGGFQAWIASGLPVRPPQR